MPPRGTPPAMESERKLFFVFYFGGDHLDEFVDIVGRDDTSFLKYEFDAVAKFRAGGGSKESGGGCAYSHSKHKCEKSLQFL